MDLPYIIFIGLSNEFRYDDLISTPDGQKMLEEAEILNQTQPDLGKIRNRIKNTRREQD